jgi:hypothetical protein
MHNSWFTFKVSLERNFGEANKEEEEEVETG